MAINGEKRMPTRKAQLVRKGLYTNGKTVAHVFDIWPDGGVSYDTMVPYKDDLHECSGDEFIRRYPHRVTGVILED